MPIGLAVAGANRPDMKLVFETLSSLTAQKPESDDDCLPNLCLDRGYDYLPVRELVLAYGYNAHIRTRGDEIQAKQDIPHYRAKRWIVERSHSWMNRFRRLLIRWEKNVENYEAMLHFACAFITYRAAGVSV